MPTASPNSATSEIREGTDGFVCKSSDSRLWYPDSQTVWQSRHDSSTGLILLRLALPLVAHSLLTTAGDSCTLKGDWCRGMLGPHAIMRVC